ncbi:hypothetical protein L1887_42614 [Cichorium endivia]|nr:hypothetical protein L1887_42614 [Cichorium endivia]
MRSPALRHACSKNPTSVKKEGLRGTTKRFHVHRAREVRIGVGLPPTKFPRKWPTCSVRAQNKCRGDRAIRITDASIGLRQGRCQTAIPSGTAEAPLDREELRIKSHMGRFSHPLRSFPASPGEPGRVSCAFCFPSFFLFLFLFPPLKIIPEGLAPEQVSLTDADYGLRGGEPEGQSQLRQ